MSSDVVAPAAKPRPSAAERRERFALEYAADLNAARAYAAAYGVKPENAARFGLKLLREPAVAARIAELLREKHTQLNLQAEHVIAALTSIAFLDKADLYDPATGRMLSVPEMPPYVRKAIDSIEVEERYEIEPEESIDAETGEVKRIMKPVRVRTISVKLAPRMRALELLMRHKQLLHDHVPLTMQDGNDEGMDESALAARVAAILEAARRRRERAKDGEDLL